MAAFKNKIIPVIFGLHGQFLNNDEIKLIKNNKIYGFIIFERNILNLVQLKKLIKHIKSISPNDPLIMIDHEGGRVNRFNKIFSQKKYTAEYFGKLYLTDRKNFYKETSNFIDFNVGIFKFLGIDTIAYPVADLKYKKTHKVIGDRSFSNNPKIVNKLCEYFIEKYQDKGINCIAKHAPGHGLAVVDSHFKLPIVEENKENLFKKDFLCFKNLRSKFLMIAHIKYIFLDFKIATYSSKILTLIRKKINFKGLIMTDDICMKALKENLKTKVTQPLLAGCDIILHCNGNINEMKKIIGILKKWMSQKI